MFCVRRILSYDLQHVVSSWMAVEHPFDKRSLRWSDDTEKAVFINKFVLLTVNENITGPSRYTHVDLQGIYILEK